MQMYNAKNGNWCELPGMIVKRMEALRIFLPVALFVSFSLRVFSSCRIHVVLIYPDKVPGTPNQFQLFNAENSKF